MDQAPPLALRRMVIVSGKGGVGRTTIAAALARAAVRAGKRVLLAQMDATERLGRLLGSGAIGPEVVQVSAGLDAVNMTARAAMHQYGVLVLRYEAVARALFDNRAVHSFLGAVPGLDAYAMLGKAWWHTTETDGGRPRYDLVIVDGPASGHAATMLKIPGSILQSMPRGPLARDAGAMQALFRDLQRAAFLIVTAAEELPARETAQLARTVRERLQMPLGPLIVNALPPAEATRPELAPLLAAAPTGDDALDATLRGAALLADRRRAAERVLATLRRDPGLPMIELPRMPTADLGPSEVDALADALHAAPGITEPRRA